jgi:hypothetical protein
VCAKPEGGLELLGHGVWRRKTEDGSGGLTSCGQQPVNATVAQSCRAELGMPFQIETVEGGDGCPILKVDRWEMNRCVLVQLDLISRSVDSRDPTLTPGHVIKGQLDPGPAQEACVVGGCQSSGTLAQVPSLVRV